MIKKVTLLLLLVLELSGCLYANVKTPLDTDVNNTELGAKVGHSSSRSVLWLFAWGDSGTAAAAKEGNISVIKQLDSQYEFIFFGLYTKQTTIAYGD